MTVLPFACEQLLLSLEAAGHIPPVSQRLKASAENSKEKVSTGSSVAEGCRALFQVNSHLLRRQQMKSTCLLITLSQVTSKPTTPAMAALPGTFFHFVTMDTEDRHPFCVRC